MRSFNWKTVSTLVTMMAVAGCQENVSAPQGSSSATASMMLAPVGAPQLNRDGQDADDVDFTVTPKGGVFLLGKNAVVFPAGSICDPSLSSYGADTWDDPCVPLKRALKIHATIRTAKLGTWIDFSPSVRFVPTTDPKQGVYIYMYTPAAIGATDLSKFSILWAPAIGAAGVNEAAAKPSLRTYVDTKTGVAMAKIEHFTGYLTSSGRSCDPAVETDCYPAPGGFQ
ncbi:hypothetical protein BH11GEM1_BH11GEM1_12440 [soil metagenome]